MKSFEELKVWQEAHKLATSVYRETKKFPKEEQCELASQLKRLASSSRLISPKGPREDLLKNTYSFFIRREGCLAKLSTI